MTKGMSRGSNEGRGATRRRGSFQAEDDILLQEPDVAQRYYTHTLLLTLTTYSEKCVGAI
jgi:hypothetical protein